MLTLLLLAQVYVQEEGGTAVLARRLNCVGAALTCSVANGTATMTTAAPTAPGGNTTEVQYNNAGAFGGMANFETDGTRPSVVTETLHPSTPAANALHYDYRPNASLPPISFMRDAFTGIVRPRGMFEALFTTWGLDAANWYARCARTGAHNSSTVVTYQHPTIATTGGFSPVTWASTNLRTRTQWGSYNGTATVNVSSGTRANIDTTWRGLATGEGGWLFRTRVNMATDGGIRAAFGLFDSVNVLTATADPSTALDSVYFGCDYGQTTLNICSNDDTGSATCGDLGGDYQCTIGHGAYDMWLSAAPFSGGINYYIQSLGSGSGVGGTIGSDLPRSTVQLAWQNWMNSGPTIAKAVNLHWSETCIADNL